MHVSLSKPKNYLYYCFIILFLCPWMVNAQQITVSGKVMDSLRNEPVAGVSVQVAGSKRGVATNASGNYTLQVPSGNSELVFSYTGYSEQRVRVGNRTVIDIVLSVQASSLNDIVVVGYGSQRRKDITGSVVSLDKQRLENMPNSNFAQALQGSVPGVSITTQGGGAEGNDVKIRIRGQKSIRADGNPLVILDGIPYNGSISDINPTDIASAEILKDASAAGIYGSRASAGVILITTKKGSSGKPVFSYDGFTGTQQITNLPDILTPEEFYQFKKTRNAARITGSEQAVYDSKNFPDWLDLATRNGMRTQHTLGARGGGANFKYYASLSYLKVKGIAVNDKFDRVTTRVNLEANLTNWLTYGTNTQLSYDNRDGAAPSFSGMFGAYLFNPLTTAFDSSGKPNIYPWPDDKSFANPLAPTLAKNTDDGYKVFTTNYLQVKLPLKGLAYRLNTGIEYEARSMDTYYGRDTRNGVLTGGDFTSRRNTDRYYVIENILTFDRSFKKHTIGFTGLYSYEERRALNSGIDAQGFPGDILTFYQASVASLVKPSADLVKRTLVSQMGRLNYGFDSRFLLTLTGRRDGSSVFGANNKFAFFPIGALAWNISNESFMTSSKVFSNLKLRLSYGSNGNQGIDPYQTLAELSSRPYVDSSSLAAGYVPTRLGNDNLKWETTKTANIGLDFGFFNDRLQGSIDVYDAKTNDLLLFRQISPVQGVTRILQNVGSLDNKGIELGLNSINIQRKNVTWSTNANISMNRNKITDLYGNAKNDTASRWFINQPIDVTFDYVYDGVWQLTDDITKSPQANTKHGFAKVRDLNNDGKITPDKDKMIQGSYQPSFIWGLGNTVRYRNFTFYIFAHGVHGVVRENPFLSDNNVQTDIRFNTGRKNWWTPTNPTNDFYINQEGANTFGAPILQNSSFVRIKDISLSYDFSNRILQRIRLTKLRVYVQSRNPFTITNWTGLDPELTSSTAGGQQGIPLQKEFIIGLNVSL